MVELEHIKILSNIFIAFIGSGVLGLPYAFKRSGLIEGAIVMAAVAYFSMKAMLLLIDCLHKVKSNSGFAYSGSTTTGTSLTSVGNGSAKSEEMEAFVQQKQPGESDEEVEYSSARQSSSSNDIITYSDVAFAAWGPMGRMVVDSSLVCAQVGFCCGYLIFITENLSDFIPSVPKSEWLVLILPPLFFLTLIPDLSRLAVFSLLAQVSNLLAFAVVYWFDFEHLHLAQAATRKEVSLDGFPFFFCAAVYCFEGAGMILSLEQSVPAHRRPHFKRYFVCTIGCITTLYISFGASGYLSFGPETKDIITLNLSSEGSNFIDFALLVKLFLCISLFFSYPIMLFPVTRMLQRKYASQKDLPITSSPSKMPTTRVFPLLIRFSLVTISGLVVTVIPNFSTLMNIIGAVFGTILAFIMPALCHYSIFRRGIKRSDLVMDLLLVVVGCMGCFLGVIEALLGDSADANAVVVAAEAAAAGAHQKPEAAALVSDTSVPVTSNMNHIHFANQSALPSTPNP